MDRAELSGWLRLTLTPGVGNEGARKLLAAFGLPDTIFGQSASALAQLVSQAQATAIRASPPGLDALLDSTWDWLQGGSSGAADAPVRRILTLADAHYPAPLLASHDPPLVLYLLGHPGLLQAALADDGPASAAATAGLQRSFADSIAIVGSRNMTPQGAGNARQFAKALGQAGLTVVSGMALGIDGAAHEGALDAVAPDASRLATVAVVGTGLDRVYPKTHLDLARRIARHGLILSEYPIGTPPLEANFPKRNRLIAALSKGTLVVEAALKSGSLITARLAAEQGKEVFAIPGSIHSTQSRGCHALIKQGAKLVESAQDVLEELRWGAAAPAKNEADASARSKSGNARRPNERPKAPILGLLSISRSGDLSTSSSAARMSRAHSTARALDERR